MFYENECWQNYSNSVIECKRVINEYLMVVTSKAHINSTKMNTWTIHYTESSKHLFVCRTNFDIDSTKLSSHGLIAVHCSHRVHRSIFILSINAHLECYGINQCLCSNIHHPLHKCIWNDLIRFPFLGEMHVRQCQNCAKSRKVSCFTYNNMVTVLLQTFNWLMVNLTIWLNSQGSQ